MKHITYFKHGGRQTMLTEPVFYSEQFLMDLYNIVVLHWNIKASKCQNNEVKVCVCAHMCVLGLDAARAGVTRICPICSGHFWKTRCQDVLVMTFTSRPYRGDRCNIRMYTVELQVQTKRCGIVFSVFSKAESLRIFLNKIQRSFFLWKKITTCHFLEKR